MSRAVFDTSVFVARETGRPLGNLPDEGAVSVVTLAELEIGVMVAADTQTRARRLWTLKLVRETATSLPIDGDVASAFAAIVAELVQRGRKAKVQGTWIAATAVAHNVPIFTQDDDFADLPGVEVLRV